MQKPFEQFISEQLKEFERHLTENISGARHQRMRGAREFAVFLLGRPHKRKARGRRAKYKLGHYRLFHNVADPC